MSYNNAINDSSNSNFFNPNYQSNVTSEKEKSFYNENIEYNSEEEEINFINEYLSKNECDENCKEKELKIFYLFYSCFVKYECETHGIKVVKFNDYFKMKEKL